MKKLFLFILFFYPVSIFSITPIYITEGNIKAMPVFINRLATNNNKEKQIAEKLGNIIVKDLNSSQILEVVNSRASIEDKVGIDHKPNFPSWRIINADFLMNGSLSLNDNIISVKFNLWDVCNEQKILLTGYQSQESGIKKLGHKIADEIFEKITGNKGCFDTKIAYVAETRSKMNNSKKIAIMDYDGSNVEYITHASYISLSPSFSSDNKKIIYCSYKTGIPRIYIYDLLTKQHIMLGDFVGLSFAPRFSNRGNHVLLSIAKKGSTNIYEINLQTKKIRALTNDKIINTSPFYSPDDKKIVFSSDRTGSQQLYIMDLLGENLVRISRNFGSYSSPTWSPLGDKIAFVKTISPGRFGLGVMNIDGSDERIISSSYLVESPSWSPCGQYIIFTKYNKADLKNSYTSNIYKIHISGIYELRLPIIGSSSEASWSFYNNN